VHLSIFLVINQLNTQILLCMSSHHADYSSSHFLCPAIMLITPAPTPYVQSSCWLLQHLLCMSVIMLIILASNFYTQSHADYSSTLCVCPVIMLIIPAPIYYVQPSWWLFQHPLPMSSHHADYSSTHSLCPIIMLIIPAPNFYIQSSCWLFQHPLCMSSHHADYSSTFCVCPVIMLIIPAPIYYVQSSCWLLQHPLCPVIMLFTPAPSVYVQSSCSFQHPLPMSSHHADYSITPCLCPVILLITPSHIVYFQSSCWLVQLTLCMSSRHSEYTLDVQTLLVSHYVRRHVFSVLVRHWITHYLKCLRIMRILLGVNGLYDIQHVGWRGGGGVSVCCGVLSQLGYYSISGMRIPAVQRLTACGLQK